MRLTMGDMVLEGTPVEIAAAVERIEAARAERRQAGGEEELRQLFGALAVMLMEMALAEADRRLQKLLGPPPLV